MLCTYIHTYIHTYMQALLLYFQLAPLSFQYIKTKLTQTPGVHDKRRHYMNLLTQTKAHQEYFTYIHIHNPYYFITTRTFIFKKFKLINNLVKTAMIGIYIHTYTTVPITLLQLALLSLIKIKTNTRCTESSISTRKQLALYLLLQPALLSLIT